MGECIITRSTIIPEDVLNPIYPVEGRHVILATLKTDKGSIVQDYEINCKDGTAVYNYKTDMNGQVKFSCNSGSANIYVSNVFNGAQYIDFPCFWTNVSAPVGDTSRITINLPQQIFSEFTTNKSFKTIENRNISNIILVGGGGGGGSSIWYKDSDDYYSCGGGGGGAGYMNTFTDFSFIKNNIYNFIAGSGGGGGNYFNSDSMNGNSGGTSYIVNTNMSALGGGGGGKGIKGFKNSSPGIGGLGNGAIGGWCDIYYYSPIYGYKAEDSSVNFAGGGGGSGSYSWATTTIKNNAKGGFPYGGNGGAYTINSNYLKIKADTGSRGGGGGGGALGVNKSSSNSGYEYMSGGRGGYGLMRINIQY